VATIEGGRVNQSDLLIRMGKGTNPACDRYVESFLPTGCENCGHTKGEHRPWPTK
jgi:hypothetical protein